MSTHVVRARAGRDRPSLYQEITDKIIADLEVGRVPWVQPWGTVAAKASLTLPKNAATQRQYSGINVLILWDAVIERGCSTQNWLTFRQALRLGGNVRKGEHGTTVVYADRFVPDDGRERAERDGEEPNAIPFLKRFTVFNTDQCERLPAELTSASAPVPDCLILSHAEAFIAATRADFRIGGDRAFYSPAHDFIQVPRPEAYFAPINWHRTALHELGHWTGHPSRLARDLPEHFGSALYAKEELVAEMTSAFVCASLGVVPTVRHADYIGSWLEVLREDDRAIVRAASAASKAADFLLAFRPGTDNAVEAATAVDRPGNRRPGNMRRLSAKYGHRRRHFPAQVRAHDTQARRIALGIPRDARKIRGARSFAYAPSEEGQALQQFSTPIELGFGANVAAAITSDDLVLESSAGTGLLAIYAELAGAKQHLNELANARACLLDQLFGGIGVTRHDTAHIRDHLEADIRPTVVPMNPRFSVAAHVDGRVADAAFRHVSSALARLADGGRLVAITDASLSPDNPAWREGFVRLQERARVVFSAAIDGRIYARHGTSTETRLTVIDRIPADDPPSFPASPGVASDAGELLDWVTALVPPRPAVTAVAVTLTTQRIVTRLRPAQRILPSRCKYSAPAADPTAIELVYETIDWTAQSSGRITDALYEEYALHSIRLSGAQPHPTRLVQSAAMASVAPPKSSYRLHLPPADVTDGLLSDAQLESVIYAGEAHAGYLAGAWTIDETFDVVSTASDDAENAIRFRRGWFLGDATGTGKSRQVAGILLDNWLKDRCRAAWISKSDKLIEDAQRDWSALGQERLLITPLSRFRPGSSIRFITCATLRSDAREEKLSRVQQIVDWLGRDFDGVIVFDESHAMQNAAGEKSEPGERASSQQGTAGLRLQHALPNARVLYVSATGVTTVHNLVYAQRLGLWGGADFPFATRAEFVEAIEAGGVSAMEVLARDLKALGLNAARSLSFAAIEYELLEHQLADKQVRIYVAYAAAFQVIHNNLNVALQAANVTGETGALNSQTKSAARSAFESAKRRSFNHLIRAMRTPTLIARSGAILNGATARSSGVRLADKTAA